MNFTTLSGKVQNSRPLDFGSIFNRSIELFKQVWLQGFITLLLTLALMVPFYILYYIPFIVAGIMDPETMRSGDLSVEVFVPMVALIPLLLISIMVIALALNAAFLRICKQKDLGESAADAYFFYFNKKYLGKIVVLSLLMLGISLLGMLACGIGMFYVMVPLAIMPAFLAFDEDLSAMEIVKLSFALGHKNWLVVFGLVLLMGILAELGILLCFVGILFTAMLAKVPIYFVYKDSIGVAPGE